MSRERFHSVPLRTSARTYTRTTEDAPMPEKQQSYVSRAAMPVMPDDDEMYQSRPNPTSSRRWNGTEEVYQQGDKRLVVRRVKGAPPPPQAQRRRVHWLFPVGVTLLILLVGFVLWNAAAQALQAHTIDSTYGYPRTYQMDAVVGHKDSAAHPSHFQFENFHGHVIIIEFPGGDATHARVYTGPVLYGPGADLVPVTGSFVASQHTGYPDMLIQIGTQTLIFHNNGTEFVTQS